MESEQIYNAAYDEVGVTELQDLKLVLALPHQSCYAGQRLSVAAAKAKLLSEDPLLQLSFCPDGMT